MLRSLQIFAFLFHAVFSCSEMEVAMKEGRTAMFFMGSSMLDVGTNQFVPNSAVEASPPYAPGRFSNGFVISDFLEALAGLPPLPPYLKPGADHSRGANFASGGSGLLEGKGVVDFGTQLAQLKNLTELEANHYDLPNSVMLINVGTNDLQPYVLGELPTTLGSVEFVEMISGKLEQALKDMYGFGIRKIAIIGISPLGCTPKYRLHSPGNTSCWEPLNELVQMYNTMVQASSERLSSELPELQIIFFDAFQFFSDMINNGSKYGFSDTTRNCCGTGLLNAAMTCGQAVAANLPPNQFICRDPSKFLYWDYHPTQQAYLYISEAIWAGSSTLVKPVNLKTLIGGS